MSHNDSRHIAFDITEIELVEVQQIRLDFIDQ